VNYLSRSLSLSLSLSLLPQLLTNGALVANGENVHAVVLAGKAGHEEAVARASLEANRTLFPELQLPTVGSEHGAAANSFPNPPDLPSQSTCHRPFRGTNIGRQAGRWPWTYWWPRAKQRARTSRRCRI